MSELHLRYAEEIAALSGAKSAALRRAFAKVRRESFLPKGPWLIEALNGSYYPSDDDHPQRILHGVGVGIDPSRQLNNANPVKFAEQMMALDPRPGERVFHVGAGLGYYTALLAELVGPPGRVLAAEIDPGLREEAAANLAAWPTVTVTGDALEAEIPAIDILYSSAGMGKLPRAWLAALKAGGRMIAPITDAHDHGLVFLFHKLRDGSSWSARLLSFTRHYPCLGTRDTDDLAAVAAALPTGPTRVASLVTETHRQDESCWLHGDGWCLSTTPPG